MLQDVKIFNFAELKEIHRERRVNFSEAFSLRIHRGLSWVQRAEKEINDPDASFIFYWIAFNSAYSAIQTSQYFDTERRIYKDFFEKILKYDKNEYVYNAIWKEFSGSVRSLLNNQYIFGSFWNF